MVRPLHMENILDLILRRLIPLSLHSGFVSLSDQWIPVAGLAAVFLLGGVPTYFYYKKWPPYDGRMIYAKRMCSYTTEGMRFFARTHLLLTDCSLLLCSGDRYPVLKSRSSQVRQFSGTVYKYGLGDYDAIRGTAPNGRGNVVLTARRAGGDITPKIYLQVKDDPQQFIDALVSVQPRPGIDFQHGEIP